MVCLMLEYIVEGSMKQNTAKYDTSKYLRCGVYFITSIPFNTIPLNINYFYFQLLLASELFLTLKLTGNFRNFGVKVLSHFC